MITLTVWSATIEEARKEGRINCTIKRNMRDSFWLSVKGNRTRLSAEFYEELENFDLSFINNFRYCLLLRRSCKFSRFLPISFTIKLVMRSQSIKYFFLMSVYPSAYIYLKK